MFLHLVTVLIFGATTERAFAMDCPISTLECKVISQDHRGTEKTVLMASARFVGINEDEPSESPTECMALLSLPTRKFPTFFRAEARGESQPFRISLSTQREYTTIGKQILTNIDLGQEISLIFHNQEFRCTVK